ncbi:MAG: hypothetical protein JSS63_04675 [Bacteroidetes bacterium]|nr:hypothetical protein [Bacteroidota bacterium]
MQLLDDLKRPFNLITFILAILGIVLTIFFYNKSNKEKLLTYYKVTDNALIYDNSNSSNKFKVITSDSSIIKNNIYLIEFVLWNNGDFAIDSLDVREPFKIVLDSAQILSYSIQNEVRPNYSKFTLTKNDSNSLILKWRFFDPHQALKIQVMYASNATKNFKLMANILDILNIPQIEIDNKLRLSTKIFYIVNIIASSLLIFYIYKKQRQSKTSSPYSYVSLVIAYFIMITLTVYAFIVDSQQSFPLF